MVRWLIALLLLVLLGPPVLGQGKLQQVRNRPPEPPASPAQTAAQTDTGGQGPPRRQDYSGSSPENMTGEGWAALGVLALIAASSPFWLPPILLEDSWGKPAAFPAHPYALQQSGYLLPTHHEIRNEDRSPLDCDYLKPWAVRLAIEDGNDFDGLNRLGATLTLDTSCRCGVSTSWNHFTERVSGVRDTTTLGDVHFTYRFAQGTWGQFRLGAGARFLFDQHRERAGFSFLYGAELFPADPVVVQAQVDLGNLGEDFALRARTTVGVQLHRYEIFAGYEFQRIGRVNLQGPLVGIRLSF